MSEFRPSAFPALSQCIRFEGDKESTEYTQNGDEFHDVSARMWTMIRDNRADMFPWKSFGKQWHEKLKWCYNQFFVIRNLRPVQIELEVPLLNEFGEQYCLGHIDVLFETDKKYPYPVDWKTGLERDYSTQLMGYSIPAMERYGVDSCSGAVAFVDLGIVRDMEFDLLRSTAWLDALYEEWKRAIGEHKINVYCEWCALKTNGCPAWTKQAQSALATIEHLPTINIDALKNDPPKLEEFLLLYDRFVEFVEDHKLKSALQTHFDTGYSGAFYNKVNVGESTAEKQSVDVEQWLLKVLPEVGRMRAAQVIKIDAGAYASMWQEFREKDPLPVPVKTEMVVTRKAYSYIRRKGK